MIKKGLEYLPYIQKMERLLGHNLNITEDIIVDRVNDAVAKQISLFNLKVVSIDVNRVDWNEVIRNSAFRKPPFNSGEVEKGFRDAVLAETFSQIVVDSPSTPRICRIAVVTADELLETAIRVKTANALNVRILKSIDELKSLISTLASSASEELIAQIKERAAEYFFSPSKEETLFYAKKLRDEINSRFAKELEEMPGGAIRRKNEKWYITAPLFNKKEGQRITWISSVEVEAKAIKIERNIALAHTEIGPTDAHYRIAPDPSVLPNWTKYSKDLISTWRYPTNQPIGLENYPPIDPSINLNYFQESLFGPAESERLIAKGRSKFEIKWSHILTTTHLFRAPRIDDISFIGTNWE